MQDLPPINIRDDIGLSDQELVVRTTKELNKLLKNKNIPKERQKQIKQERRTLKNRGYAANCRDKREKEEKDLDDKNKLLRDKILSNRESIAKAQRETEELIEKYRRMDKEVRTLQEEHDRFVQAQQENTTYDSTIVNELMANRTEIIMEKIHDNKQSNGGLPPGVILKPSNM